MDKEPLRHAILQQLQQQLDVQTRAALTARDEATSEESRAENKYDTRGQEAAYLAEGQARIATELLESIAIFTQLPLPTVSSPTVDIGAVVTLRSGTTTQRLLVVPRHGGLEIQANQETITLVTPISPLGRQLVGKRPGEPVLLPGRKPQTAVIAVID